MKNILFFLLLFYSSDFLQAQDPVLTINVNWLSGENGGVNEISKTYIITKDSLIMNFIGFPQLTKVAFKLNISDSSTLELLNVQNEKWLKIENLTLTNCDSCCGAKISLQKNNVKTEYWIRCVSGESNEPFPILRNKILALIRKTQ